MPKQDLTRDPVAPRLQSRLRNTQALVDRYVAEGCVAGMVAVLGIGDHPPLIARGGYVSFEGGAAAVDADTLWRIYSMTKPITAAAAMMLVDDGCLALDDPVATHLPEFATMRVLVDAEKGLDSRPAERTLTVRHLLTHTSGMIYSPIGDGPLQRRYRERGLVPLMLGPAAEAEMRQTRAPSLAAFARRAAAEPLMFEPGTAWAYGISTDVVGRLIEAVSGLDFESFVEARIIRPLDLKSTFWTVPATEVARFATNYVSAERNRETLDPAATSVWLTQPTFPYGGGGLVSSARDYERFLRMLQNGGILDGARLLRPATVSLMLSNLLPAGVTFEGIGGPGEASASPGPTGFGAGGSVYEVAGSDGFPGVGTYGWGGAAGSVAWLDPANGIRGLLMINVMGGVPGLREEVERTLVADARELLGR